MDWVLLLFQPNIKRNLLQVKTTHTISNKRLTECGLNMIKSSVKNRLIQYE